MAAIRKKCSTLSRVSAEEALFEYAKSLKRHCKGRLGVLVNISALTRYSREARHIRSSLEFFDPLMSRFPGQLFALDNDDIVCAVDGAGFADIDEVILRIRYLFRDDENLKRAERNNDEDILCRWFNIGEEFEEFLEFARARFDGREDVTQRDVIGPQDRDTPPVAEPAPDESVESRPKEQPDARPPAAPQTCAKDAAGEGRVKPRANVVYRPIEKPATRSRGKRPLQPSDLAKVEAALETMDVATLVRRQNICLLGAGDEIRPIIVEHFIPIRALEERLLPETDIASNPWLIQHLCGVLDLRMLRAVGAIRAKPSMAVSLRCTIETILSREFENFCASAEIAREQRAVIEISAFDVLANPQQFQRAKGKVADLGFRICIGDMEPMTFTMLDRRALGADFEKIRYRQWLLDDTGMENHGAVRKSIRQAGPHRVILCACDSENAIRYGRDVGIRLFQGRAVESRLKGEAIAASA